MTCRQSDSSSRDMYSKPLSRLSQQIGYESTDEGCPVLEESGTVCGETNSLCIFQEFRQMYDDCLKKLEGSQDGSATLRKLAPFKKLIDDLWEQNTLLVETVEELEQEATCKVTKLQDRLNKSCQKVFEYKEDIKSLILIIQNFFETGVFDATGFKFNTLCPASVFGTCKSSCPELYPIEERESETSCGKESDYLRNASSEGDCFEPEEQTGLKCDVCFNKPIPESCTSKKLSRNYNGNFENKNFSQQYLMEDREDSYFEPFCSEENKNSLRNGNQSNVFENVAVEESDFQGCQGQPININFNIGRNAVLDNSDCCCDCSCMLNTFQNNES